MKVVGKGTGGIQLSMNSGDVYPRPDDMIYVPDLNGTLLLVGKIKEQELHVTFAEHKVRVQKDAGALIHPCWHV